MKAEKQILVDELLDRIKESPFLIVTDYSGLDVGGFQEVRNRLRETGAKCQVIKNTLVKRAAKEAGLPEELAASLTGQTALVTGESDVCAAAKVLQTYHKESEKAEMKVGVLDGELMDQAQLNALASLPTRDVLLAQLLGVLQAPASKLVRTLNEPGSSFARLLKAKEEQG